MTQRGLAASQEAPADNGGMSEEQLKELLAQIVQALMNGITPEELMKQGVPREIIEAAIQIIQQQAQQGGQSPSSISTPDTGLAAQGSMPQ